MLSQRNGNNENAADVGCAVHGDASAVCKGYVLDDGQTQSCAAQRGCADQRDRTVQKYGEMPDRNPGPWSETLIISFSFTVSALTSTFVSGLLNLMALLNKFIMAVSATAR